MKLKVSGDKGIGLCATCREAHIRTFENDGRRSGIVVLKEKRRTGGQLTNKKFDDADDDEAVIQVSVHFYR